MDDATDGFRKHCSRWLRCCFCVGVIVRWRRVGRVGCLLRFWCCCCYVVIGSRLPAISRDGRCARCTFHKIRAMCTMYVSQNKKCRTELQVVTAGRLSLRLTSYDTVPYVGNPFHQGATTKRRNENTGGKQNSFRWAI